MIFACQKVHKCFSIYYYMEDDFNVLIYCLAMILIVF